MSEAQRDVRADRRPGSRLSTVPNGIRARWRGPGRARARELLGLDPVQPVVLAVGRMVDLKGHRHLVEALPELVGAHRDVAVVVLGSGPLRDRLRDRAGKLGVGAHLHLPGFRTDARMLLDAADVLVLPSLQGAMPLAVLEALDAELPVVATDAFGTAEC